MGVVANHGAGVLVSDQEGVLVGPGVLWATVGIKGTFGKCRACGLLRWWLLVAGHRQVAEL